MTEPIFDYAEESYGSIKKVADVGDVVNLAESSMTVVANGITDSWDSMKNAAGDMRKGLQDVGNRLTTGFNDAVQVAGRGMKMAADWTIQAAHPTTRSSLVRCSHTPVTR